MAYRDAGIKDAVTEFAKGEFKPEELKKLQWPIKEHTDKETGEVTTFVRFKSKKKPLVFDAKKNKLPPSVEIGGGSRIRVGATLNAYAKGPNKGVNLYLNAVQVIELQQGFNINDFDEEDGYVADGDDDAASEFDL